MADAWRATTPDNGTALILVARLTSAIDDSSDARSDFSTRRIAE